MYKKHTRKQPRPAAAPQRFGSNFLLVFRSSFRLKLPNNYGLSTNEESTSNRKFDEAAPFHLL